ncbi:MAG: hypothetical protein Greene041662_657 [Candidatus Peregrinibacteria bacterium Greene0416_62]|nr:MAG: hypothetical protein Greene041662_657 [Candidatus Peregrinibacteria bacterium Greene0416_62]TSD00158.1 MAG: hypothetical protein Greene101449_319 [Candidatus Peregrinibacteria bacterium Greene1014_49]
MAIFSRRATANGETKEAEPRGYVEALRERMLPKEMEQLAAAQRHIRDLAQRVYQHAEEFRRAIGTLERSDSALVGEKLDAALADIQSRCACRLDTGQMPEVVEALESIARQTHAECNAVTLIHGSLGSVDDALSKTTQELLLCEHHITRLYQRMDGSPLSNGSIQEMLAEIKKREDVVRERSKRGFAGVHVQLESGTEERLPLAQALDELSQAVSNPVLPDPQLLSAKFSAMKTVVRSQQERQEAKAQLADEQSHGNSLLTCAFHARIELEAIIAPRMLKYAKAFDSATSLLLQHAHAGHNVSFRDHRQVVDDTYQGLEFSQVSRLSTVSKRFTEILPADFYDCMDVLDLLTAELESALQSARKRVAKLQISAKKRIRNGELAMERNPRLPVIAHQLEKNTRDSFIAFQSAHEKLAIVSAARWAEKVTSPVKTIRRFFRKMRQK